MIKVNDQCPFKNHSKCLSLLLHRTFTGYHSIYYHLDFVKSLKIVLGKDLSLWERPAGYQLVGKVMAYQGYDG